jgi:AraC-like DNA-binding protein
MDKDPVKEKRHGSARFPLDVYQSRPSLRRSVVYSHWHDEAEFFLLTRGRLRFHLGEKSFPLKAGEAVFVRSGEVHAVFDEEGCVSSFTAIVFNLDLLSGGILRESPNSLWQSFLSGECSMPERILSSATPWGRTALQYIAEIAASHREASSGHELSIIGNLYSIFACLIGQGQITPLPAESGGRQASRIPRLKAALVFMRENFKRDISISDISGAANMSLYHFTRFFRKTCGCTPLEHLQKLKVAQADKLLTETDMKVQDIAAKVGFNTVSHFIKTFKRLRQYTPAAFRRSCRETAALP